MSTHILSFDSDSFCPALVPEFGAEEAWCLPNLHPLVVRNCFEGRIPRSAFGRWPVWTPTFGSVFFSEPKAGQTFFDCEPLAVFSPVWVALICR